jgi:periplasmic protein TonB
MSRFLTSLAVDSRRELHRWVICGAIVVMAHVAGVAVALVHWADDVQGDETGDVMMVDLAPPPIDTSDQATEELPPGPEQIEAEAAPEKPVEEVQKKVEELVRADNPDVVLPEEVKPEPPKPVETAPPAPETTAPQLPKLSAKAIPTWTRQIMALLEHHKRYPAVARDRHEQGVVQLAFSLDQQGHVTSSHIAKSSGYEALDHETLELVKRAEPFPAPPSGGLPGSINLTLPIRFNLR